MRWLPHSLAVTCAAVVLAATVRPAAAPVDASQQASSVPSATESAAPAPPDAFNGTWDYNDPESVNAANGRPERGPKSASQRRATPAQRPPVIPSVPNGGTLRVPGSPMPNSWGTGGAGGGLRGPGMPDINTWLLRDLQRDLMEVPERIIIRATSDQITITDDLERELTFPTNGRKQKYQTGAAVYDARMHFDNGQFKKLISAPEGFKMSETYFLSADRQRLFVIIRLGEPRTKNDPIYGVNRVYDRVDTSSSIK